jgi:hypothetical protein
MKHASSIAAVISMAALASLSACAPSGQSMPSTQALPQRVARPAASLGNETILHVFGGAADGGQSTAPLIMDGAGNMYGTAAKGGRTNTGVVFEFHRDGKATWKETILHSFSGGKDGGAPLGGLTRDAGGNLYGVTSVGGSPSCTASIMEPCGVVFQLTHGGNHNWKETVLHTFSGKDGAYPISRVTFDKSGDIFGTTEEGGTITSSCIGGCGVVYELVRNGSKWNESVLHTFSPSQAPDDEFPQSRLIFDANGDLFGTTYLGEERRLAAPCMS